MKILGIIGVVVGVLAVIMGAYLHFAIAPAADLAETVINLETSLSETYYGSAEHVLQRTIMGAKTDIGEYTLLVGGIAFLLSFVPAIKKQNFAWIGVVLGLIGLFIGAAYGTHMFS